MAKVLDSSAVLALLQGKPGSHTVFSALPNSEISSVNVVEVLRVLVRRGTSLEDARRIFARLHLRVIPFDDAQAAAAASVGAVGRHLSLGDCACLGLARTQSAESVLTADRTWASHDYGVSIELVR